MGPAFLGPSPEWRCAGLGPKKLYFTGTKRKILAGPEPGPKKKLPGPKKKLTGPNKKELPGLGPVPKKFGRAHL